MEQTGYVNSKIDEIGDLTKKMTNAMTSNILKWEKWVK